MTCWHISMTLICHSYFCQNYGIVNQHVYSHPVDINITQYYTHNMANGSTILPFYSASRWFPKRQKFSSQIIKQWDLHHNKPINCPYKCNNSCFIWGCSWNDIPMGIHKWSEKMESLKNCSMQQMRPFWRY